MRFWDSSALLALLARQPDMVAVEPVHAQDPEMVLWWATRVELASAIARLRREGTIGEPEAQKLLDAVNDACRGAHEVVPSEDIRNTAVRLLRVHSLRAADALQLAAAIAWADHDPSEAGFVCVDRRLREAASKEGFRVLPESR